MCCCPCAPREIWAKNLNDMKERESRELKHSTHQPTDQVSVLNFHFRYNCCRFVLSFPVSVYVCWNGKNKLITFIFSIRIELFSRSDIISYFRPTHEPNVNWATYIAMSHGLKRNVTSVCVTVHTDISQELNCQINVKCICTPFNDNVSC